MKRKATDSEKTDFKLSNFATKISEEENPKKRNRGAELAEKDRLYEIKPEKAQELSKLLDSEVSIEKGHTHVRKVGSKKVGNVDYTVGSKADLEEDRAIESELKSRKKARTTNWKSVHEPLRGKTVFITGGNAGIGKETAKHLHQKGAEIHISGRNQETLNETVKEIGDEGIYAIQADVSTDEGPKAQFSEFEKSGEKIDVLFVNAGIFDITPGLEMSREKYRKMMSTNLDGAIFTIQEALPHLNDGAVIIVNTSIAADLPDWNNAIYSLTKKALENYAIGIASDPRLASRGIRSVAISPGLTDTEIFKNALGSEESATKFKDGTIPSIPVGRAGTAKEMAETIEFIVQNEYFNAEVLDVNGGLKRAGRALVPKGSSSSSSDLPPPPPSVENSQVTSAVQLTSQSAEKTR